MIEGVYQLLYNLGYTEPIHPAIVHIPIGLVIGAFVLGLLSFFLGHAMMGRAARYAAVLAFIFLFPALLLGYMDWHHFFAGGWLFPIKMKLALAGLLLIFTFIVLIAGRGRDKASGVMALLYTLCFLTVIGLGYFGGLLVYEGRVPEAPSEFRIGERVFLANCSGCHPFGGNIIDPEAQVRGSDDLRDSETFIRWIRDPRLDNGSRGIMPSFPPMRISDDQAEQLRLYIVRTMEPEGKPEESGFQVPKFTVSIDPASIGKGRQLFLTNCKFCHTVESEQTIVGPGLKDILKREKLPVGGMAATPENIFRQLRHPYKNMPSFAQKLTNDQVFDLIAYLNTR